MKKELLYVAEEFLTTQMNHWFLFTLMATLIGLLRGEPPVMWTWAALSLLPFALFFPRRYVRSVPLMLGAQLLITVLFALLPSGVFLQDILLRVLAAGYFCRSLFVRIRTEHKREESLPPVFSICVMAAALFLMHQKGTGEWDSLYVMSTILLIGCYFIKFYLDHYLHFLSVNESSSGHIPAREMLRSGLQLTAAFTLGGMAVLFVTSHFAWLSGIVRRIGDVLLWLLRRLLSGMSQETVVEEPVMETQEAAGQQTPFLPVEDAEPALFWQVLEKLVIAAAVCALLAAFVMGLWTLLRFLIERLRRNAQISLAGTENVYDVREKCEVTKRRERRSPFGFLQPRERIRRIYQKRVLSGRKRIVGEGSAEELGLLTARECAERLQQERLAAVYEKARYSQEECTMEDVRALKEEG